MQGCAEKIFLLTNVPVFNWLFNHHLLLLRGLICPPQQARQLDRRARAGCASGLGAGTDRPFSLLFHIIFDFKIPSPWQKPSL